MTDHEPNQRLLEVLGDEVQFDVQGPPEHRFQIYDDGEYMVVKEGEDWKVQKLAGADSQGHQGQPKTVLEGGDESEVLEILRREGDEL